MTILLFQCAGQQSGPTDQILDAKTDAKKDRLELAVLDQHLCILSKKSTYNHGWFGKMCPDKDLMKMSENGWKFLGDGTLMSPRRQPRSRPEDAAPTSAARSDEAPGELNYEAAV